MNNMHWNMVEEKLPELHESVLVCVLERGEDGEWSVFSHDISWRDLSSKSGWAMGSQPPEEYKIEYWSELSNPYAITKEMDG